MTAGQIREEVVVDDMTARREEAAVTEADLHSAAKLAGVAYTQAEYSLMQGMIAEQITLAVRRRAVPLPADLPPATRFDPRLPGFIMPEPVPLLVPEDPRPLPEDDAGIAFAPVAALAHWIKSGQLSCLRLTEIYLERIERYNRRLLCYTLLNPEARDHARALDAMLAEQNYLGPLHGIPYACKDIIDTKDLITDWGAEAYRGRMPETDAVAVTRLREAGAVLLGKSTVGALAYGDLWYGGRTRNPWNIEEGSSGSSAGSASATAAGLCAFSLGTETLGSIVSPSTRCGTVGLRPTFGRVARTGTMMLCPSLDKIGPICRNADDTALVLAAINGADPGDVASIEAPFGGDIDASIQGLRLGWFPADFKAEGAPNDAMAADRATLDAAAALGAELIALERPDLPYDSLVSLLMAEAAASFEPLTLSDRDDMLTWQEAEAWPNQFRAARFLSAVDHVQLDRFRRLVMREMDRLFAEVDAILGPSLTGSMLVISNFTGHPCLCLPDGCIETATRGEDTLAGTKPGPDDGKHHVPRSISIWGRLFDEATPLRLGRALQARLGLDLRPPAFRE
jgi:Asp-tRNA(Asn)/Glu-tRNA(Gln) amidotransferase A subunit family amidase